MFELSVSELPVWLLAAAAATFAAAKAVLEARRDQSRDTLPRYIAALALLVIGLTFTFTTLQAREELARTQEILRGIQRTLEKIEGLGVSFEAVIRPDHPELRDYREALRASSQDCLREPASPDSIVGPGGIVGPRVLFVELDCLPDSRQLPVAYAALTGLVLALDFIKDPASAGNQVLLGGEGADISAELSASSREQTLRLAYDRQDGNFILRAQGLELKTSEMRRTGQIAAVSDLEGASLIVSLRPFGLDWSEQRPIHSSLRLGHLYLTLSAGRSFECNLEERDLKRVRDRSLTRYEYRFQGIGTEAR